MIMIMIMVRLQLELYNRGGFARYKTAVSSLRAACCPLMFRGNLQGNVTLATVAAAEYEQMQFDIEEFATAAALNDIRRICAAV